MLAVDDPRHGTNAGHNAGCRCDRCNKAKTDYNRNRYRQTAYGRWEPFVDAEPVRAHLKTLSAAGLGWQRAANLAGVTRGMVESLMYDKPPVQRCRKANADAILAVQPTLDVLADRTPIPDVGTTRRLRALVAIGWPMLALGQRLPCSTEHARKVIRYGTDTVTAGLARATRDLYDELSMTPAPDEWVNRRAKRMAEGLGWVPPLLWDDVDLDDAGAQPLSVPEGAPDAVDIVAVWQVLDGHAPLSVLRTPAELTALWLHWMRYRNEYGLDGPGLVDFGQRYGVTKQEADRIRTAAVGRPGRKTKTTTAASECRTNERKAA